MAVKKGPEVACWADSSSTLAFRQVSDLIERTSSLRPRLTARRMMSYRSTGIDVAQPMMTLQALNIML